MPNAGSSPFGEGNTTVFYATGKTQHNLINIAGSGGAAAVTSTSKKIQGTYIPVGRKTFTVEAGHTFVVGDNVFLQRKPNQAWIAMLGMDKLNDRDAADSDWSPSAYTINYKRKVVAVSGNNITLDAPLVDPIDAAYAEGFIMKYTWAGKIENIGIQNIYFDSYYVDANDENHGWDAIRMDNVENAWVRNIEAHHFGYSAVDIGGGCSQISVLDSKCLDPISQTTGGRKYSFSVNGQRILVKNCTTRGGRHDFVTGSGTAGPNAFVNCTATQQKADIGPHHRWATGILFDNVIGNGEQNVQNRLTSGSGHGWAGAQTMFWNCTGSRFKVQSPPNHINWAIGCKGVVTDDGNYHDGNPGVWQSTNNAIKTPSSLYEQQLCERLGLCGVAQNQAPTVSISAPTNNSAFTAPASVNITANAADADGTITKVEFFNGATKLGEDLRAPYAFAWNNVAAGTYSITARATDNKGAVKTSAVVSVKVNAPAPTQSPYTTAINIPGTVQAENFDKGGEGLAYHDLTAANEGGQYRTTEAADIEACSEGGYNVGWIATGEWLEYTVNVTKTAKYDFNIRQASIQTGSLRIELDGVNISNTVNTTNTNGWQNWSTVSAKNISLTTGTKVMRVYVISGAFNLNYIEVKEYIATPPVTSKFKVVGYMPSWAGDVNAIQYSKLTHINYSFIRPTATGGLTAVENGAKLTSLVAKAHAANVKVGIAIGGWSNLNNADFEGMASTLARRTTFINNVMNFVNQYGLDGVDIDWEYPVAASAANFELLMDELGKALHAKGKFLTAAVIGEGAYYGQYIRNAVFADVDFLNIMAYDGGMPHSTYNFAVACINYWKGRGLAKEKIVLGVPFYGKSETQYVAYNTICTWDANAQNKDVVNGVYYNGIPTIKAKTKLAVQQAGGIMIWEISQDATGSKSLLTAINEEIKANGAMKTGDAEEVTETPENIYFASVYPNPLDNGNATLSFSLENEEVVNISVYDANGKLVFQKNADLLNAGENTVVIDSPEMSTGLYLINISSTTENKTLRLIHK